MTDGDHSGRLFGPWPDEEPVDGAPAHGHPWQRWAVIALAGAVVVALVGVLVSLREGTVPATASVATQPAVSRATAAHPGSTPTTVAPGSALPIPPPPTASPAEVAAARAEFTGVAGRLDAPLSLRSPAEWDQWAPGGKPYPGASTAEDIATCPRLASRLTRALGVEMSYWTGTLPQGPYGCRWVPVPLRYDGPYTYAYDLSIGFLADGTTTGQLRTGFYEQGGVRCPAVDVPAGPGAVALRCRQSDELEYLLTVPDARGAGVWVLSAVARDGARHTTADVLIVLVDAAAGAYAAT